MNVTLQPQVLRWARERAGLTPDALAQKLKVTPDVVGSWEENGELRFTWAEALAKKTHTPFGYLFLPQPPDEPLPIRDFRTVRDEAVRRPSPDLLDTIYTMQRRQAWMREFLIEEGAEPLPFVASATPRDEPRAVAESIRDTLGLAPAWASRQPSWGEALRHLRQKIEEAGILIVINGVVGNNTHRKLDPEEFRGFVLVDDYAPLIFINGRDAKAAQMFTFAHELAHLWLGEGGVTNTDPLQPRIEARGPIEQACNHIAAEFLVPEAVLHEHWQAVSNDPARFQTMARRFKVSEIVVARRAQEIGLITRDAFFEFYEHYKNEERPTVPKSSGGNFWNTQNVRLGDRFGRAVVQAARERRILYHQAYQLSGLGPDSFHKLEKRLGFGNE